MGTLNLDLVGAVMRHALALKAKESGGQGNFDGCSRDRHR